jgi:hypothetical protein
MAPKAEKAGPVAGTDLRNFDLAINSENSRSILVFQVARLTRHCAMTASMAEALAPIIFWGLSQ